MTLFGRAAAGWARCSMVMAMAAGCGSGSGLPSQRTDERLMAHEASLREEDDPNPFVFTFDSHRYGISMKEWAFNWMRWEYSIPAATNPTVVAGATTINTSSVPSTSCPTDQITTTPLPCLATRLSR